MNTSRVFIVLGFFCTPRSLVAVLKEDAFSAAEVNIITVAIVFLNSSLNPLNDYIVGEFVSYA